MLERSLHCLSKSIMEIRMQEISQELSAIDWPFFTGPAEYLINALVLPVSPILGCLPNEDSQLC